MSDGGEVATITSLEQFFLSRDFGHSEEVELPIRLDELWLSAEYDPQDVSEFGKLEEVFLSRDFGQPLIEADEDNTADHLEGPSATVLAFTPRDAPARHRAVAVISGVAAAALVVAGVAAGSGHPNNSGVTQAQAPSPAKPGGSAPSTPPSSTPVVPTGTLTLAAASNVSSEPEVLTSATGRTLVGEAPPGTTVTVVSTPPPSGKGTGTGTGAARAGTDGHRSGHSCRRGGRKYRLLNGHDSVLCGRPDRLDGAPGIVAHRRACRSGNDRFNPRPVAGDHLYLI